MKRKSKIAKQCSRPDGGLGSCRAALGWIAILIASIGCARAAAQEGNPAAASQPPQFGNGLAAQPACYLGEATPMSGAGSDIQSMQDGSSSGWEGARQNEEDAQPGVNVQPEAYDQPGSPSFGQTGQQDQDSTNPQQQQGPYSGSQPAMSADQIVSILQAAPDELSNLKELAGQRFGVDPSTIPDRGVYNCIRQDPGLRNQAAQQLISHGYIANPKQMARSMSPSGRYARSSGQGLPMPNSRRASHPAELRKLTPIPYPDLPSLDDLYSQEIAANVRLRRFGSDAFLFGTGNVNQLPMDLPVGPDYVLGSGDNIVLNMWGGRSERLTRTIDRQGDIALPEAGTILIAGLTISQAQGAIQRGLGAQFQDEHVEISLGRVRTVRVYVVGDVQRPGAYDVSSLSTPLNALYAAGGPTGQGSLRTLKQYRGKELVHEIDLYDFLLQGVSPSMDRLLPGDTILVPPVGPQVTVAGAVRRPAIYELKGKEDLQDILNVAGGVLVSADLKEVRVERVVAHERHTMLRVQIPDAANGEAAKLAGFEVQDGDSIQVSPILPYNNQVVYLEGHVFKPGQYAWREGMTVSDLLHSYQDVMPEPASHAEIVRLVPPDLHPEAIPFSLPDLLIGNDPIALQPFDTVRVFGRYEIDPPTVSIFGSVVRPGKYPMSQGMTVTGLVRMAGGLRRSAFRQEADLTSYAVESGQKILVKHSVVELGKALEGDRTADADLQPGDVVGVRQLSGWNDIGASITVSGEVKFAGTYGITDGERLSSVLKRAGGFRSDAYPEGAVFERIQVRQLEEQNRQEMIRRVESTVPSVSQNVNGTSQDQQSQLKSMQQQQQQVLASLRSHPSTGRLVIKLSADIGKWENTPADIEIRAGDTLIVPKRPDFVLVAGQVYNATAISYRPGKDAGWYLRQAGGATHTGDKKAIFILRADGSVVGDERSTIFDQGVLGVRMHPGDSIVVPDKIIGGSQLWKNIIGAAQIASSVAITGSLTGAF